MFCHPTLASVCDSCLSCWQIEIAAMVVFGDKQVVANVYHIAGKGPERNVKCCRFMKVKSVASKYRPVSLSILMNTLTLKSES